MHWLYLVVSLVFVGLAMQVDMPGWAAVLLVLGSLGMFLAWMVAWTAARVSGSSRNEVQMITGDELRHMREQAEARKAAAAASRPPEPPQDSEAPQG
jgi:hypothetical protein